MEKKIKVSVIVPIYNVEKYLERCIKNILNQTFAEIEIILVDDGSTDSCSQMCDEFANRDSRIVVVHKKNEGLGYARNSGLQIARGEYVAFIDSDDYIDENFFEELYKNANDADLVMTGYRDVDNNGEIIQTHNICNVKTELTDKEIIDTLFYNTIGNINGNIEYGFSVWKAIYKRDIFYRNDIKFCSEREFISEDYIFQLDFIPKCQKAVLINTTYYNYCKNEQSLSRKYNSERFTKIKELYQEIIKKIKKLNLYQDTIKGIDYTFIGNVRACIKQEKNNCKQDALENIKKMCNDPLVVQRINSGYNQTLKQRIFDILIKLKLYVLLYYIIKY